MKVLRGIKYRLYPTPVQEARLEELMDQGRRFWNCLCAASRGHYCDEKVPNHYCMWIPAGGLGKDARYNRSGAERTALPTMMSSSYLTGLRGRVAPKLPRLAANIIADSQAKAWGAYFRRLKEAAERKDKEAKEDTDSKKKKEKKKEEEEDYGRPKFKSRYDSIGLTTMSQGFSVGDRSITWQTRSTGGPIRAVIDTPLPGKPKRCTISRDVDQWYASVLCEVEFPEPVTPDAPMVGLDRGVVYAVADSEGRTWDGLKERLQDSQRRLERKQRQLSRKKKGSANRNKARLAVAREKRYQRRVRNEYNNIMSKFYAENYSVIVVEDLDVKNMTKSAKGTEDSPGKNVKAKAGLNRSILSQGWSDFLVKLKYKAEVTGAKVVEVPAAYSSQTCSACGHVSKENRQNQARFVCTECGYEDNADVNAAKVILSRYCDGDTACGGPDNSRPMKQESCARRAA